MGRKILVTSGKGGVGKTTIVASLGIALSSLKQKVLVVDLDVSLNNLDTMLNLENKIVYDLADVLSEKCRVNQALVQSFDFENLYLLPSSHFTNSLDVDINKLPYIINQISLDFDYVIIDCSAGVEGLFYLSTKCANEAILVVTPHISSIRDAEKVLNILNKKNFNNIKIVVNRIRGDLVLSGKSISHQDISEIMQKETFAVIPEIDKMNFSSSLLLSKYMDEKTFRPYLLMAQNLISDKNKIYDYISKYKGFWGGLKRVLKTKI